MLAAIPLSDDERGAVDEGLTRHDLIGAACEGFVVVLPADAADPARHNARDAAPRVCMASGP
ncbi:hypothetical protein FEZ60_30480 [Rhodococcus sp. MS16]|uniref:hypothetical protein n=1 Tax=Rhodococcus sp. MS16 TaxID=2579941 RepID=UPI001562A1FD|nr:hypothetical protein [Rhodococcus sp. MS16]NRI69846.1 hypothetical protein [Rhodococcus sp. MS16]